MAKIERFRDKVMACWLGKAVGGTLGMPFEGKEGVWDLSFYDPVPTEMLPNDDLDLQVLWACVLDKMPQVRVDRNVLGQAWLDHVDFPWDEYGVCIRNLRNGLKPPLTGSFDNWFTCGMGAAIRSEIWACLAPGNPALAAKYAYEDACTDHSGEGIYSEVFFAALESAAFVETRPDALLDQALAAVPAESLIARAVTDTRKWIAAKPWREVRELIVEKYGHENFTDVVQNVAFTVLGWLACKGDFSRGICIAVDCGKDTDCTGATVGSIMGIMNPDCIDSKWLKPIGRDLVINKQITGIKPPPTLDGFTDLVISLHERLGGRAPEVQPVEQDTRKIAITAEIAFVDAMPQGDSAPVLKGASKRTFAGTHAILPRNAFELPVGLVRYKFKLHESRLVRVMFNAHEATRVWVDGKYAFGREGGAMSPSLHRVPVDQFANLQLNAGEHEMIAAIAMPKDRPFCEWVVAVGRADTMQWLHDAFLTH